MPLKKKKTLTTSFGVSAHKGDGTEWLRLFWLRNNIKRANPKSFCNAHLPTENHQRFLLTQLKLYVLGTASLAVN